MQQQQYYKKKSFSNCVLCSNNKRHVSSSWYRFLFYSSIWKLPGIINYTHRYYTYDEVTLNCNMLLRMIDIHLFITPDCYLCVHNFISLSSCLLLLLLSFSILSAKKREIFRNCFDATCLDFWVFELEKWVYKIFL